MTINDQEPDVALLAEGVGRNSCSPIPYIIWAVALLAEGVGRNAE